MKLKCLRGPRLSVLAVGLASVFALPAAQAFSLDTGDSDLKVNWDNTFKYLAGYRLASPDQKVAASTVNPNVDFGDLGHGQGLINNRVDLLSELDVRYRNLGFRLSGAAWFDSEYDRSSNDYNANVAPNNQAQLAGAPFNQTHRDARKVMGRKAEFADAFVFGKFNIDEEKTLTLRAGQHTLLFGETLFLRDSPLLGEALVLEALDVRIDRLTAGSGRSDQGLLVAECAVQGNRHAGRAGFGQSATEPERVDRRLHPVSMEAAALAGSRQLFQHGRFRR